MESGCNSDLKRLYWGFFSATTGNMMRIVHVIWYRYFIAITKKIYAKGRTKTEDTPTAKTN
jgi:hypothetical protein